MSQKRIIIILIALLSGFILISKNLSYAKEIDLFDEITSKTESKVIEYGVTASFTKGNVKEEELKDILKTMGYYDLNSMNISTNKNVYTIDFSKGNVYGFIEAAEVDGQKYITIDVKEKNTINNINKLKRNIENATSKKYKNIKYHLYLKSQLQQSDLTEVNNEIIKILKNHRTKNIDTIELNNGFSTIAYTKKYETIKNNGKLIDFNYAVMSYSSGNYIIISTPIIKEIY